MTYLLWITDTARAAALAIIVVLLSVYVQQSVIRSSFSNAAKQTVTSLMPQG